MTYRSKPIVIVSESSGPRGPRGSDYFIETTGMSKEDIVDQLFEFAKYAKATPGVFFLLTPIGRNAGYTVEVIAELFDRVFFTRNVFLPANIVYQIEDNQFGGNIELSEAVPKTEQLGLWDNNS